VQDGAIPNPLGGSRVHLLVCTSRQRKEVARSTADHRNPGLVGAAKIKNFFMKNQANGKAMRRSRPYD
jgi:hypothetical protein